MRPGDRPQKHALEFHDSEILSARKAGLKLEVTLDGYLHCESEGRKTGWSQSVVLMFANGQSASVPPELPAPISTGNLFVAGEEIDEPIQLPFESAGSCSFFGLTSLGQYFGFIGDAITMHAEGDAKYVEEVPF